MTDKLIHCPECDSENLDNSVYCCQCGSPMRKGIPARLRKSQWGLIAGIAAVLAIVLTLFLHLILSSVINEPSVQDQGRIAPREAPLASQASGKMSPLDSSMQSHGAVRDVSQGKETAKIGKVTMGTVMINDRDGKQVAEFPAPVINGSWLALPTRACIGGDKWFFRVDDKELVRIEGGLWGRGDAVGLWRLAGDATYPGPGFDTWRQEKPVRLLSTRTGRLSDPMSLTPSRVQGAFIYSVLSAPLDPGVFFQDGQVVGWSFGDMLDGAYMWTLGPGSDLPYTNYVDDFYSETFAGGREEAFAMALAAGGDSSPQRQLQLLADGFRLRPKLTPQDTPRNLRTETVYPYILRLVNHIMDQGGYHYIATLTEEPLLWEARDPELTRKVILSSQRVYGTEVAVDFMEGPGAELVRPTEDRKEGLKEFHLGVYLEWIKGLVDSGDVARGWQVYARAKKHFSDSPDLQLLGVELALADGDWAEAENLLYQRDYPIRTRETWMLLADRISDLKGLENKIVVRFAPGSREIGVKATVNGKQEQDFLVDTGASFVTIPSAAVEALGLSNSLSSHLQEVQTPGGPVSARAVTLASIELQGWSVSNVKALVMDLPNRPGLGLLGLNFLDSFRMDLRADEGILTLEPK